MYARHSKRALGYTVAAIAALWAADATAQIPTPNDAAAAGACLHIGGLVTCPNNPTTSLPLPPGSGSSFFTFQGGTQGTVWNIFGSGSTIFIPTTNFPPFVPPIPTPPVVTPTPPVTPPVIPPVTTPTPPVITPTTPTIPNPFAFSPVDIPNGPGRTPPDVREAFAELRIPIIEDSFIFDLSQSDGARYSDYALSTPDSRSFKIGGSWAPVRDIRFRGNYSRAVRAPNVFELFTPSSQTFNDPLATDPLASPSVLPDRADLIHNLYNDYLGRAPDDQGTRLWIGALDLPPGPGGAPDTGGIDVSDYFAKSLARGFDPNGLGFQGLPIEPIPLEGGVTFIPFVVIPDSVAFDGPFSAPPGALPLAGDFNGDGTVDAADYVVWRKGDGSPGAFDMWRDNFGTSPGQGAGGGIFGGGTTPTITGDPFAAPGSAGSAPVSPPAAANPNDAQAQFVREQAQSIARTLTSGTPEERAQAQKNLDDWGNQALKDAVAQAKLDLQAPRGKKSAKTKSKSKKTASRSRALFGSPGARLRTAQIQTDASLSVIPANGGFAR